MVYNSILDPTKTSIQQYTGPDLDWHITVYRTKHLRTMPNNTARTTQNSQRAGHEALGTTSQGLAQNTPSPFQTDSDPYPANPDHDDEGTPNPDPSRNDELEVSLAVAIRQLSQALSGPKDSRTKLREPDTFDGSNPQKLNNFLLQCELNFQDRPQAFLRDRAKVNYATSYL